MVRHRIAVLPDDGIRRGAIGVDVTLVGRDDAVVAIDHHKRLVVGVDQRLQFELWLDGHVS